MTNLECLTKNLYFTTS